MKRKTRLTICAAIALCTSALWLAPVGWSAPPTGKRLLLFIGSNTLGENAVPNLAKAYLEQEKKAQNVQIQREGEKIYVTGTLPDAQSVYVEVHATGSGDCFKSFLGTYAGSRDVCDIGMSSRRIKGDEVSDIEEKTGDRLDRRSTARGLGTEHAVALDGLAIVAHASNPLTRISFKELHDIYSRKITDWKEMKEWKTAGGADTGLPMTPVRRREPSGTLDFFVQQINPEPAPMKDVKVIPAFVANEEVAAHVATLPGSIGFIGQSYPLAPGVKRLQVYNDMLQDGPMMPEEASFPDPAAVQSARYPLSRIVYFYTASLLMNDEVQPFLKFTLGPDGQTILATSGGLTKIEGTRFQLESPRTTEEERAAVIAAVKNDKRKTKAILRLHGSNTVGANCAVSLAFNYLMEHRAKGRAKAPIEDFTTEMETPEGEKALAHDVMCDLDGDGTWETIEIRPTGSSDAFRSLLNGWCDIGMSSRHISEAEVRDLQEVCGDLSRPGAQFALGLDALAIIANSANKVEHLTLDQVGRVFLGNTPDWGALGGEGGPVHVHSRPERSGTYRSFCDALLHGRSITGDARRHAENSAVAAAVAGDLHGIGFVPSFAVGKARSLSVGHDATGGFHLPSPEAVRSAQYPASLCRYVYLYVPEEKPEAFTVESRVNWEAAREFAMMSQTWRGQLIVAASGFVPEVAFMDEGGLLRQQEGETTLAYVERLADVERKAQLGKVKLRPALREREVCARLLFDDNQTALSNESRNTLQFKLASWLRLYPDSAPNGFLAEGWTDDLTSDAVSAEVSARRASAVATFITSSLDRPAKAVGKGKSSYPPNDSEENKHMNRRVVLKVEDGSE